jgi:AcrR family transcriptional regulator
MLMATLDSALMNAPLPHRDGDATRERLLRAALDLYTTLGFLRTTTPALAERAGVAEGTIYRHFRSKKHLLNEAYRLAHRWGLDALSALESDRTRKAPERLALLGRQVVDLASHDPALVRMLLSTANEPFLDEPSRGARRELMDGLIQLVAMGKSDGQVRSGPAELWAQVWLLVVGFAAERVAAGEWTSESAPTGLALESAWDAVAAQERSVPALTRTAEDGQAPPMP